jgi:2-dehydropantoate 2-reductase
MEPRIAVIGAGAVGGYVGGHLARLGHDVTLIDAWPAHIEAIRADGLDIAGVTPEEHVVVRPATMHLADVQNLVRQRPIDIAIVSVKSYDTEWATTLIRPYLSPSGYVVSLQNCINEERIAALVGWGRVIGCIAARISVDLYAPGHIRRTVPMGGAAHTVFRAGEPHGRITRRLEQFVAMIAGIDSVKASTNLWGERWSKLCLNGMRNAVSAATGLSGNEMDTHAAIRRVSIRLGGEAVRVGQALGYDIEPIGNLQPERLARAVEGDRAAFDEIDAVMLAGSNAAGRNDLQRPSMGQDILKGRRTEIGFMNGFVAAKGEEVGRPAPTHAAITALVERIERAEVSPRPEHLTEM